jgi:DNA helicase-2/ATP-dependent DNA helicase PcrA
VVSQGKTTVLSRRIQYLIEEHGQRPDSILALTFTNKAALEIKERLGSLGWHASASPLATQALNAVTGATFHSLCASILREFGHEIGIPRYFCIYDADEQKACVKSVLTSLGLDAAEYKSSVVLATLSKALSRAIQQQADHGVGGSEVRLRAEHVRHVLQAGGSWRAVPDGYVETLLMIHEEYTCVLRRARALDFDMLLSETIRLLAARSAVLTALRRRWPHVLVDEWQDINIPQYRLVQLLAGTHGFGALERATNASADARVEEERAAHDSDEGAVSRAPACSSIFVVGDEDQRIYGWRGAVADVVRSFASDFEACQIFTLEPNFRSTRVIAAAAQHVIEGAEMDRNNKTTRSVRQLGEPVRVFRYRCV